MKAQLLVVAWTLIAVGAAEAAVAAVAVALVVAGIVRPGVDEGSAATLVLAALATGTLGGGLWFFGRGATWPRSPVDRAQSALLAGLGATAAVALPVAVAGPDGWPAALVEAAATLTGTGLSGIADVDGRLARPLLLWRGVAQGLGAVGVIALGGLVRGARGVTASMQAWCVLLVATVALLWTAGLPPLDAAVYGVAAASTGGLGTYAAGAAGLPTAARLVLVGASLLAGFRPTLWPEIVRARSLSPLRDDDEARAYLSFLAAGVAVLWLAGDPAPVARSIDAASTTGLMRPGEVGGVALLVAVALTAVGGCRGSPAGGIGPARCALLLRAALWAGVRALSPSRVAPLDPDAVVDAAGSAVAWAALVGLVAALVAAAGGTPVGLGLAIGAVVVSNGGADAVGLDAAGLVTSAPVAAPLLAAAMLAGRIGPARVLGLGLRATRILR